MAVLEANAPGEGASSRSGGMVGGGHRQGFTDLAKRHGEDLAVALMQEGLNSLAFVKNLITREKIECQYQPTGRFRAAWSPGRYDAMAREIDLLRPRISLEANMISAAEQYAEVATDAYSGGCVYHDHGALHPGLFHLGPARPRHGGGNGHRGASARNRDRPRAAWLCRHNGAWQDPGAERSCRN